MLGWDCITPLKAQLGEPFRALDRDCRARSTHAIDSRNGRPRLTRSTSRRPPRRRVRSFPCRGLKPGRHAQDPAHPEVPLLQDPLSPYGFAPWDPGPRAAQRLFIERFDALERTHQSALQILFPNLCPFPTLDEAEHQSNPDDDPAFDIDPDGDAAAYDEWAALAGEPARPPPEHPQRDFADSRASFDAITSSLTKTQIKAASHPGSSSCWRGLAQAKRRR